MIEDIRMRGISDGTECADALALRSIPRAEIQVWPHCEPSVQVPVPLQWLERLKRRDDNALSFVQSAETRPGWFSRSVRAARAEKYFWLVCTPPGVIPTAVAAEPRRSGNIEPILFGLQDPGR